MSSIQNNPHVSQPQALPAPAAPDKAPAVPQSPAPQATPSALENQDRLTTYEVKKGDTLWDIAQSELSDAFKWPEIHALNKDQVKNPDLIYPGQVLTLPKKLPPLIAKPPVAPPAPPPVAQPPAQVDSPPTPVPISEPVVQPKPPAPLPVPPSQPVAPPAPKPPSLADQIDQVKEPQPAKGMGLGKAALIGGAIGTVGTAGALMYTTSKLGTNLGGYATAQVVAKNINNVIGKVGLSVPSGPGLSSAIKAIGGPKVAGAATAVGVGLLAAGVAVGGYYLYQKATD